MKNISSQRRYLEEHRWSVFTDDLTHCYICNQLGEYNMADDKHEILYGSNRWNSMKWGYVLPLCRTHHNMFHDNHRLTLEWEIKCQEHFVGKYSKEEWMRIFHRDYKELKRQKYKSN